MSDIECTGARTFSELSVSLCPQMRWRPAGDKKATQEDKPMNDAQLDIEQMEEALRCELAKRLNSLGLSEGTGIWYRSCLWPQPRMLRLQSVITGEHGCTYWKVGGRAGYVTAHENGVAGLSIAGVTRLLRHWPKILAARERALAKKRKQLARAFDAMIMSQDRQALLDQFLKPDRALAKKRRRLAREERWEFPH